MTLHDDIEARLEPHRRELLAFCYRMLGSVHDAEDVVQDTMLRAWRARDRYDPAQASLRTWLYRIATNACLTAAGQRGRRALPTDLHGASHDPAGPLVPATDVSWLQPLPDSMLTDPADDPAAIVTRRADLRLALVAAMQRLPARQRAAVILREALACSATEIAAILDTTPAAVNSALQRARATLDAPPTPRQPLLDPDDADSQRFVEAYVTAFERADVAAITAVVTADVILEMPPVPTWFVGRADYGRFMTAMFDRRGPGWQLTVTRANGQPALAAYARAADGTLETHSYQVLEVRPDGIGRHTVFYDQALMAHLGVPTSPS